MAKENVFRNKRDLAMKIFKECKKIEKKRNVTMVEKNNIKYVRTLMESTIANPNDDILLSNLLISLRGILESKRIDPKNAQYFQASLKKLIEEENE